MPTELCSTIRRKFNNQQSLHRKKIWLNWFDRLHIWTAALRKNISWNLKTRANGFANLHSNSLLVCQPMVEGSDFFYNSEPPLPRWCRSVLWLSSMASVGTRNGERGNGAWSRMCIPGLGDVFFCSNGRSHRCVQCLRTLMSSMAIAEQHTVTTIRWMCCWMCSSVTKLMTCRRHWSAIHSCIVGTRTLKCQ